MLNKLEEIQKILSMQKCKIEEKTQEHTGLRGLI